MAEEQTHTLDHICSRKTPFRGKSFSTIGPWTPAEWHHSNLPNRHCPTLSRLEHQQGAPAVLPPPRCSYDSAWRKARVVTCWQLHVDAAAASPCSYRPCPLGLMEPELGLRRVLPPDSCSFRSPTLQSPLPAPWLSQPNQAKPSQTKPSHACLTLWHIRTTAPHLFLSPSTRNKILLASHCITHLSPTFHSLLSICSRSVDDLTILCYPHCYFREPVLLDMQMVLLTAFPCS